MVSYKKADIEEKEKAIRLLREQMEVEGKLVGLYAKYHKEIGNLPVRHLLHMIHLDSLKHIDICQTAIEILQGEDVLSEQKKDLVRGLRDHVELEEVTPKTHIVSSGVDKEAMMSLSQVEAKLAQVPDPVEIVTFCRLDPSKGVHYGIRAAAEAARGSRCQLKLTLAGIPTSQSYLRLLGEERNLVADTLSVEIQTFDRIFTPLERNRLLDRFHIYLLPTLNEPFGMTIIEAGARGNLIVTTDTGGPLYILHEKRMQDKGWGYVTDCGICAKRTDEPEMNLASNLAKAISWALKRWEDSAEHALTFLTRIGQRFTWRHIAQDYLELYRMQEGANSRRAD